MFTQTIEYALRAIAYLAKDPDSALTSQQIAEVTSVPPDYLAKVLKELTRAELISSQRGPSGGYRLLRDPGALTVLDVVNAVGAVPRIHQCPLNLPEHGGGLCPLHRLLDETAAMVEQAFRDTTIKNLIASTNEYADLCGPLGSRTLAKVTTSTAAKPNGDVAAPMDPGRDDGVD